MDLKVVLGKDSRKLALKNPILAASGTFGSGLEFQSFGDIRVLGGICVKGISLYPIRGNSCPRIAETPAGMLNAIGLQNEGVENFLTKTLPGLPWRETAIIANIYASSVEEFGELAAAFAFEERIAAIEINVSCPNVSSGGAIFGSNARICAAVVDAVRKNAPDKFIIVKLSPNVTDITAIAKSVEQAGADCISCINTLSGMAIDARSRRPLLGNIVGGLSGPAIKPVALRCVWQVYQTVKIPVIGIGGISNCRDIIEFALAGAVAVQVGTANFSCPDSIFKLVNNLPETLRVFGVKHFSELTGALKLD